MSREHPASSGDGDVARMVSEALTATGGHFETLHEEPIPTVIRASSLAERKRLELQYRDDPHAPRIVSNRAPNAATAPPNGNRSPRVPRNNFAVLSLVFGILGGIIAIPFGHIALVQIRRSGQPGRSTAITGLTLGYMWLAYVVWLAYVAVQVKAA